MYVYVYIYIYKYIHTYNTYIYVYVCAVLEIGGIASQNANHFWDNCESLWQSESQNCKSLLTSLRITFQMVLQKLKRPFFWSSPLL